MKNKKVRTALIVVLVLALLAAGGVAMLTLRSMYRSLHSHMNVIQSELGYSVDPIGVSLSAMEAELKLAIPNLHEGIELNYDWVQENPLIAHAFGGVKRDGEMYAYTNSLEAFEENYAKGMRVFETDLLLTSDGMLAAVHDWERYGAEDAMSYLDFRQGSFYDGKLTQLTGSDIIDLMVRYPDIYIVTDTKYTSMERYRLQFSQLVYLAHAKDAEEVLDRVIVQVYNQGMYGIAYDIYPWKSVIYTLYQSPDDLDEVIRFCTKKGIEIVTMNYEHMMEDMVTKLNEAGIMTFTHTVNDMEEVRREQAIGVKGFYTDFLSLNDVQ